MISVRQVEGKGRGVFAGRPFLEGELIERTPVIVIPTAETHHVEESVLKIFYYDWNKQIGDRAIVLGYGSLYNHSYQPNARYVRRLDDREMDFVALRPIAEGEEICVNYNGIIDDTSPLDFAVAP